MPKPGSRDTIELLAAHSASVASTLVGPVADFMVTARALCGGDSDKVLLMLVIALRANTHPDFGVADPTTRADEDGALPSFGTNARSLADSTGIPRETVRRKVAELVELGWVVRKGQTLHYSAAGYEAVAPARQAIIRFAASAYRVVSELAPPRD